MVTGLPAWSAGDPGVGEDLAQFVLRNLLLALLLGGLGLRHAYVIHQWRLQVEAESEARLAALQARIRPHFLFNSLNTVAALAPTDGERAAAVVEDLADLFRASLAATPAGSTLAQELDTARAYLRLEQARLGGRLAVDWQLADLDPATPMPGLMLQPLLENAVYHGIERLPTGGMVTVRGGRRQDRAWLCVENPVPVAVTSTPRLAPGHQEALANIRERLALLFGEAGRLEVMAEADRFMARLEWPATGSAP
jgi:two-component system sensor histidine kinase AlgZ